MEHLDSQRFTVKGYLYLLIVETMIIPLPRCLGRH